MTVPPIPLLPPVYPVVSALYVSQAEAWPGEGSEGSGNERNALVTLGLWDCGIVEDTANQFSMQPNGEGGAGDRTLHRVHAQ